MLRAKRRSIAITLYSLLILIVISLGLWHWLANPLHARARVNWKNNAIAEIKQRVQIADFVARHKTRIESAIADRGNPEGAWFTDKLLVMKNGEWMAYAGHCQKRDPKIKDIFIGRGSDGKWYFSTYHFCINLTTLTIEPQPASLREFIDTYFVREFDGQSDDCLELTWLDK